MRVSTCLSEHVDHDRPKRLLLGEVAWKLRKVRRMKKVREKVNNGSNQQQEENHSIVAAVEEILSHHPLDGRSQSM